MKTWAPFRENPGKDLPGLAAYASIADVLVDDFMDQGLCGYQILRVLSLARHTVMLRHEKDVQQSLSE